MTRIGNGARVVAVKRAIVAGMTCMAVGVLSGQGREHGHHGAYAGVQRGAYSVVAEVRARTGKEAELRAATLPLVALVRSDPKNLVYFLQEDREDPGHFVFYEVFATQADFEAHNAMPYVKEWLAKLPALADGGVKVTRMSVLQGPEQ
jgi:quinol monooxygenase YgiN